MKHIIFTILMVLSTSLSAAVIVEPSAALSTTFVDNGHYHTDTTTGTEWLDFSNFIGGAYVGSTMGYSINNNIAYFSGDGWRLATQTEVAGLFDLFFGSSFVDSGNGTMALVESASDPAIQARNAWLYAFGIDGNLSANGDSSYTLTSDLSSLGMYVADDSSIQTLGIDLRLNPLSSTIYGPEFQDEEYDLDLDSAYNNLGVFMVRDHTVVPIPAAVWLFASGLVGLVAVARRKA